MRRFASDYTNSDDAGELVDENQQRDYVFAFRKIAHTLAVLKTFSKFDWDDIDAILDETELR